MSNMHVAEREVDSDSAGLARFLSALANARIETALFMQSVVDLSCSLLRTPASVIELVEGDEMVYRCASAAFSTHVGLRLPRTSSLSGLCLREARVLRADDTETDPRVDREACRRVGVRSMICVPLFEGGAAVGVLKVMATTPSAFSSRDEETLTLLAGALGAALGQRLAREAQLNAEKKLREAQERLQALLDNANDAVVCVDESGLITEWNSMAESLFGWPRESALGLDLGDLVVPDRLRRAHRAGFSEFLRRGGSGKVRWRIERQALQRSGAERSVELSLSAVRIGAQWEFLAFMHDIEDRKRMESALREAALTDALTGLPNRRAFLDACERALSMARRHKRSLALLFFDLDGFKEINDRLGHAAGDAAIQAFAKRTSQTVRSSDLVARLGGDEFVVLADDLRQPAQAVALAHNVLRAIAAPVDGIDAPLRASVGIALYHGQSSSSEFLKEADAAMYCAKRGGPGNVEMFGSLPIAP